MSKLAHSCQETMDQIERDAIARMEAGWDESPTIKEYPQREIFRRGGRYTQCQILNWETGAPPKYLACHALDGTGDFIAAQRMGTWAEIDIHEVERRLNGTWPIPDAR